MGNDSQNISFAATKNNLRTKCKTLWQYGMKFPVLYRCNH